MPKKLLYIEDDEIDILAFKRLLKKFENIELTICSTKSCTADINLNDFDFIISDSNLPDACIGDLKQVLPSGKTQFISGSEVPGENVWLKPIKQEQLDHLLNKERVINLKYIFDLAEGDQDYVHEMIETALSVLPDRWEELAAAQNDYVQLKKAAHKTKSSFRVCGISSESLTKLETLKETNCDLQYIQHHLYEVKHQIEMAVAELKQLIS